MELDALKEKVDRSYYASLDKYNKDVERLEKQREAFYKDNPDYPVKTLFINVISPPIKVFIQKVF